LKKDNDALTVPELAERTGQSKRTIQRLIDEGKLRAMQPGRAGRGNSARISVADYHNFVALHGGRPLRDFHERLSNVIENLFKRDAFCEDENVSDPLHKLLGLREDSAMLLYLRLFESLSTEFAGGVRYTRTMTDWYNLLSQDAARRKWKREFAYNPRLHVRPPRTFAPAARYKAFPTDLDDRPPLKFTWCRVCARKGIDRQDKTCSPPCGATYRTGQDDMKERERILIRVCEEKRQKASS